MVRKVKVRGLDSIADLSAAIYAETAIGVREALDAKLSASNNLSEFDTPEKRADARANLGFAALETYGPPTRTVSTDAPSGIPLDGAEWIVVVE